MEYKLRYAEIINGIVNLPDGAIPLQVGSMLTGPLSDPKTKMTDGIKYLIPKEVSNQTSYVRYPA